MTASLFAKPTKRPSVLWPVTALFLRPDQTGSRKRACQARWIRVTERTLEEARNAWAKQRPCENMESQENGKEGGYKPLVEKLVIRE